MKFYNIITFDDFSKMMKSLDKEKTVILIATDRHQTNVFAEISIDETKPANEVLTQGVLEWI